MSIFVFFGLIFWAQDGPGPGRAHPGSSAEWRTPPHTPPHTTPRVTPGEGRGRGFPFHFTSILGGFSFPLQGKGKFLSHTPTGSADFLCVRDQHNKSLLL